MVRLKDNFLGKFARVNNPSRESLAAEEALDNLSRRASLDPSQIDQEQLLKDLVSSLAKIPAEVWEPPSQSSSAVSSPVYQPEEQSLISDTRMPLPPGSPESVSDKSASNPTVSPLLPTPSISPVSELAELLVAQDLNAPAESSFGAVGTALASQAPKATSLALAIDPFIDSEDMLTSKVEQLAIDELPSDDEPSAPSPSIKDLPTRRVSFAPPHSPPPSSPSSEPRPLLVVLTPLAASGHQRHRLGSRQVLTPVRRSHRLSAGRLSQPMNSTRLDDLLAHSNYAFSPNAALSSAKPQMLLAPNDKSSPAFPTSPVEDFSAYLESAPHVLTTPTVRAPTSPVEESPELPSPTPQKLFDDSEELSPVRLEHIAANSPSPKKSVSRRNNQTPLPTSGRYDTLVPILKTPKVQND